MSETEHPETEHPETEASEPEHPETEHPETEHPEIEDPETRLPELEHAEFEDEEPEVEAPQEIAGTVAIVGFPNVGKSTLINRLTQSRSAVVHETPGVTRDRKEILADWNGQQFLLIDTGGVDELATDPFSPKIAQQARTAIEEADLVLFVVDARAGITPGDEELATILRASKKPVIVLANKIDDPRRDSQAAEFHRFGLGDPVPLSGLHGHGTGDLLDDIVSQLPGGQPPPVGDEAIRVAILGRPNVGKSSLLNALVGDERVIVSDVPGTTRDTIDTVLKRGDDTFLLVDTAGLRRKRKQRQGIDYYSELRALEAAERADVALVVIDANEGIVDQDLAVADVARKAQNSTLVALNKWDIGDLTIEDARAYIERRLRQRPSVIAVSAKTGRGLDRLLDHVKELHGKHTTRIPTPKLNEALKELRERRQPPTHRGKKLNMLYGAQIGVRPPRIRIFVNDPGLVTRDYAYWVENELRKKFDLGGVPVSIDFVKRA
jgi:GTP-binding protein